MTDEYKKKRIERQAAMRAKLPKQINAWLDDLAKQAAPKVKQAAADRDKIIQAVTKKAAPHVEALEKARAELEDARANMANVPISAGASELTQWQVIIDHWPARINDLAERVAPFEAEIRQAHSDYSAAERRLQAEMQLAVNDAEKHMRQSVPSIYDLV